MPFMIIRADVTKLQADAVVAPNDSLLSASGGVSKKVFDAAGREKLEKTLKKYLPLAEGQVVATRAYALDAKAILHTVGPVYENGLKQERLRLEACYTACLSLAAKKRFRSVVFPLISAGTFGFPRREALEAARNAAENFLKTHEMTVILAVYDDESFAIARSVYYDIANYLDTHLSAAHNARPFEDDLSTAADAEPPVYEESFCFAPKRGGSGSAPFPQASAARKAARPRETVPPRTLKDLVDHPGETFRERLFRLIDERGLKDSDVYKKANIDRKHFSKIRSQKHYQPRKSTVLAFAVALELTLDETRDLLLAAGYALSPASRADIIVSYFLERRLYNIFDLNEALFAFGEAILP